LWVALRRTPKLERVVELFDLGQFNSLIREVVFSILCGEEVINAHATFVYLGRLSVCVLYSPRLKMWTGKSPGGLDPTEQRAGHARYSGHKGCLHQ
jgi:hypothetical protein